MGSHSLTELKRHQVRTFGPHSLVPGWKEDAAEYGRGFAAKMFPGIRHPLGSLPGIKWFAGEPAESANGVWNRLEADVIWLSAKMATWKEIVTTAAHETAHSFGYDAKEHYYDHELPTLVGKLAGAHWAGEREVYVKWGPMPDKWLPDGLSEVPRNAVVLHFENGDHRTCINLGDRARPNWLPRLLEL